MVLAEARAFRAPKDPEITTSDTFPLTSNTKLIDQRILAVHRALLGPERLVELSPMMSSENFSSFLELALALSVYIKCSVHIFRWREQHYRS
jgi:hypothetical protein